MNFKAFRWNAAIGLLLLTVTIGGCGGGDETQGPVTSDPTPATQDESSPSSTPPEPTTSAANPVASNPFLKLADDSGRAYHFAEIDTSTCVFSLDRSPEINRMVLQIFSYMPPFSPSQYPSVMFRCELTGSGGIEEFAGQELDGKLFIQHEDGSPIWHDQEGQPAKLTFAPVEQSSMIEDLRIQGTIRANLRSLGNKRVSVSGEFRAEAIGSTTSQ